MGRMEHLLNVYCSKKAKDSIADFMGYCEVTQAEAKGGLTAGLWLVSLLGDHAVCIRVVCLDLRTLPGRLCRSCSQHNKSYRQDQSLHDSQSCLAVKCERSVHGMHVVAACTCGACVHRC